MQPEISYLAVLLAAASTMVVGSVWYSPKVFGDSWMKMVGLNEKKAQKGATQAIVITIIVSLITAFVLAHMVQFAHHFYDGNYFATAVTTSLWAWLGFTAARFITHDAFEQRRKKLTLMNVSHELVTFLVMGVVIGLLPV